MNLITIILQTALFGGLLGFCYLTGFTLLSLIDHQQKLTKDFQTIVSLVLGLTFLPLLVYLLYYVFGLTMNLVLVSLVIGILLLFCIYFLRHFQLKPSFSLTWTSIFFVGFFVLYPYMMFDERLAGADSYIYLFRVGEIVAKGFTSNNFDRNIVHVMPAIMSLVTGLDPVYGLKLFRLVTFAALGVVIGGITQQLTNKKLGLAASLLAFSTLSHLRLSLDIIAMHFSLVVLGAVIILVLLQVKVKQPRLYILIGYLWGCLFNSHGLVAYASLAWVGLPLIVLLIAQRNMWSKKTAPVLLGAAIAFLISAEPMFLTRTSTFYNLFLKPLIIPQIEHYFPEDSETPPQVTQEIATEQPSSVLFPVHVENFMNFYDPVLLMGTFIGALLMLYMIRWSPSQRLPLSLFMIFSLGSLALTQQPLWGFDWFSSRFVLTQFLFLIPLFFFACNFLIKLMPRQPIRLLVGLALSVYLGFNLVQIPEIAVAMFRPEPHEQLYQYFTSVGQQVDTETPIFLLTTSLRASAINPWHNFIPIQGAGLCTTDIPYNTEFMYESHLAFSYETRPEDSIQLLTKHFSDYYVLIDTNNNCLNQEVLTPHYYEPISGYKSYQLLKLKS